MMLSVWSLFCKMAKCGMVLYETGWVMSFVCMMADCGVFL